VTSKVVSIFRCWDTEDLYHTDMRASTLGFDYQTLSLNIDISLKLRDSLKDIFPPHFSRCIDKWQYESES